ncbi:fluoride efflux transporter FluC [Pelagibacterium halotolerans]|uniref:Fluoride-specific ion channel FluC n=1 Tax=Pelagibacterium halotolerans (strain DSM 22347 / JCM 15775 / CGMCC 1.7692 / B2) TaxID=1082931 RepID=G4R8S3_PELHB|nr:CrcB family protein [Pelagibacterium halotolerans]AEQ50359.1 camphor resistance CrcB protein [Pelagibacterium halotolerans B2]QJR19663.1 CrcB family protein [Pelagibacterium halotolerans]
MNTSLFALILVGLGGGIGAVVRHFVSTIVARKLGHGTFGILAVNVTGCLLIGLIAGFFIEPGVTGTPSELAWLLVVVGLCGGYTTVSSFSLQTLTLLREGHGGPALLNIGASLILCFSATAIGFALIHSMGAMP